MNHRFRRGAMVLALVAGATTTVTLFEVSSASALAVPFTIITGGSTGTVYVDALYGAGCGGFSPDGSGYDAGWDWDTAGTLVVRPPFLELPTNVPSPSPSGCGSATVSTLRLEMYPNLNNYDPWVGNVGGANSQRSRASDGAGFANFGNVPLPTIGDGSAFRITGSIISSLPIPNNRVIVDIFQVPCGFPDVCVQPPQTNTGAYVGAFTTGKNKLNQWTGSVGWPGRYQVYVKDCPTGWTSGVCAGAHRDVVGFVNIADGQVPTWDLDAPCFGILNCSYLAGGLTTPTGGFHPLPPTRILDTRTATGIANGAVRAGDGRLPTNFNPLHRVDETANHDLKVTGIAGIPAYGVSAVLLNVTAVQAPGGGWVSVIPRPPSTDIYNNQGTYGADPPASTSNINLTLGEVVPNMVFARVGAGGTIRFWNAMPSGTMHIIADVAGWFDTGATTTPAPVLRFNGVTPQRLLDSRVGIGGPTALFLPGDDRELQVRNIPGVPANAESVVLNVTAASPSGLGYVTVYPSLTGLPNASNLNLAPGVTRPNLVVVKVGTDHKIRLAVFEAETDLIVDVFGYYSSSGGLTTAIDPVRVADSRTGLGMVGGRFAEGEIRVVQIAGAVGIPTNATAVILNVTVGDGSTGGFLTVWPGGTMPNASNLNWLPGTIIPNMVMVGLDSGKGTISIFNALGEAHVIVDVFGYVV